MDSLSVGIRVPSIDCDGETWTRVKTDPRDDLLFPDALFLLGGRVAGIRLEWWPPSNRNSGRDQIGIPGRLALESAPWRMYRPTAYLSQRPLLGESSTDPRQIDEAYPNIKAHRLDIPGFILESQFAEKRDIVCPILPGKISDTKIHCPTIT